MLGALLGDASRRSRSYSGRHSSAAPGAFPTFDEFDDDYLDDALEGDALLSDGAGGAGGRRSGARRVSSLGGALSDGLADGLEEYELDGFGGGAAAVRAADDPFDEEVSPLLASPGGVAGGGRGGARGGRRGRGGGAAEAGSFEDDAADIASAASGLELLRVRSSSRRRDAGVGGAPGLHAASAAYKLQEKLQESMEALEVMANLQAEQLQYMEDHALRKLDAQDTQIADVQDDLDTKRAHLEQLKTLMAGYWETGDDSLVPPMLSLAGFTKTEAARIARHREALADAGWPMVLVDAWDDVADAAARDRWWASAGPRLAALRASGALSAEGAAAGRTWRREAPARGARTWALSGPRAGR